jgi:hypothetical protein
MITTYLKRNDGTIILLEMRMDDGQRPFVIAAGQHYSSMAQLSAAQPELCATEQLPLYCRICLHFVRGFSFIMIDDPDEFCSRYAALVRHGKAASGDRPTTADFGPFDTSEICHPQLVKDKLVFYVEDNLYAVPYRVEAPWPDHAQGVVKFLLLPQQE